MRSCRRARQLLKWSCCYGTILDRRLAQGNMQIFMQFFWFKLCTMCNDACRLFFAGHRSLLEESLMLKKVHALCTATAAGTDYDDNYDNDDVHDSSHQTKWCSCRKSFILPISSQPFFLCKQELCFELVAPCSFVWSWGLWCHHTNEFVKLVSLLVSFQWLMY